MKNIIFLLTFCITETVSDKCESQISAKVCVESRGFYYHLGNGTLNLVTEDKDDSSDFHEFTCPISVSVDAHQCDNECCFCDLDLPVPIHPILNGKLMPKGISCGKRIFQAAEKSSWHHNEPNILECKTDAGPIRFPFLCALLDNLKRKDNTYGNPNLITKDMYDESIREPRTSLSWRNASYEALKQSLLKGNEKVSGLPQTSDVTTNDTSDLGSTAIEVERILYTLYTEVDPDTSESTDYVTVETNPIKNITFQFSGLN